MENQITRSLTTKKVIQAFKAKKINLTEKDAEEYIDLIYFFSAQAFKLYNASKICNPVEFKSIEPKKPENVNYNLFANKVLVRQFKLFRDQAEKLGAVDAKHRFWIA